MPQSRRRSAPTTAAAAAAAAAANAVAPLPLHFVAGHASIAVGGVDAFANASSNDFELNSRHRTKAEAVKGKLKWLLQLLCCGARSQAVMIKRGLAIFLATHVAVYLILFGFIYYEDVELEELLTNPKDLEAIAELVEWVGSGDDDRSSSSRSDAQQPVVLNDKGGTAASGEPAIQVTALPPVSVENNSNNFLGNMHSNLSSSAVPSAAGAAKDGMDAEQAPKPTNVLFLISDQHRADALGRHADLFGVSNFRARTPYLDRLAEQGTIFTNAVTYTPQCVPSRTAILTGCSPESNGIRANKDYTHDKPLLRPVYQQLLHKSIPGGVFSAHYGKWHSEKSQLTNPDVFDVPANSVAEVKRQYNQWLLYNVQRDLRRTSEYRKAKTIRGWPYIPGMKFDSPPDIGDLIMKEYKENGVLVDMPTLSTLTQWIANDTIACLRSIATARERAAAVKKPPQPFAVTASFFHPHAPLLVTADMLLMYDLDAINAPMNLEVDDPNDPYRNWQKNKRMAAISQFVRSYGGNETRRMITMYLAAVSEVDLAIGRILVELERLRLHEETLVIYTSDHGDMLGSHGKVDKTPWFFEESVRVPLIMRHPRLIPPSTIVNRPVSLLDIAPTIVDCMLQPALNGPSQSKGNSQSAVNVISQMEGASLLPILRRLEPGGNDNDLTSVPIELESSSNAAAVRRFDANNPGFTVTFWENDPPSKWGYAYAVRTDRWKLMWNIQHGTFALYNLVIDSQEAHNLLHLYENAKKEIPEASCVVPRIVEPVFKALRGCLINWLNSNGNLAFAKPVDWCLSASSELKEGDLGIPPGFPNTVMLQSDLAASTVSKLIGMCAPHPSLSTDVVEDWQKDTMRLSPSNREVRPDHEPLKVSTATTSASTTAVPKVHEPAGKAVNKPQSGKSEPKSVLRGCVNEPDHFVDAGRRTCNDYEALHLCDVFRDDELKLWDQHFGSFADWASEESSERSLLDARSACCGCGGGSEPHGSRPSPPFLPKMPKSVLVLGLRDSGVEYVADFVRRLLASHSFLKNAGISMHEFQQSEAVSPGAFVETLQHDKHLIAGRGQQASLQDNDLRWVSRWNDQNVDISKAMLDPAVLVVVVTAHPWAWHASMCTEPDRHGMHMYVTKKGDPLDMADCLAQEYVAFKPGSFKDEIDHEPITNRRYQNLTAMRSAKLESYLAAAHAARRSTVVRIEDVFMDGSMFSNRLQGALGVPHDAIEYQIPPALGSSWSPNTWQQEIYCNMLRVTTETSTLSPLDCGDSLVPRYWPEAITGSVFALFSATETGFTRAGGVAPSKTKLNALRLESAQMAAFEKQTLLPPALTDQRQVLQSALGPAYKSSARRIEAAAGYSLH